MQEEYEELKNEYRLVKHEQQKGALVYGLFEEDINTVLNRLEQQLIAKGIAPKDLV